MVAMGRVEDPMGSLAKINRYKGFNSQMSKNGHGISLQYPRGEALAKVGLDPIGSCLTT